jgi:hypothetical protein
MDEKVAGLNIEEQIYEIVNDVITDIDMIWINFYVKNFT